MKTVTMLEFRKDAKGVLRRIARGERLVLSQRGKPAARLEPLTRPTPANPAEDPFLGIGGRAQPSPMYSLTEHCVGREGKPESGNVNRNCSSKERPRSRLRC